MKSATFILFSLLFSPQLCCQHTHFDDIDISHWDSLGIERIDHKLIKKGPLRLRTKTTLLSTKGLIYAEPDSVEYYFKYLQEYLIDSVHIKMYFNDSGMIVKRDARHFQASSGYERHKTPLNPSAPLKTRRQDIILFTYDSLGQEIRRSELSCLYSNEGFNESPESSDPTDFSRTKVHAYGPCGIDSTYWINGKTVTLIRKYSYNSDCQCALELRFWEDNYNLETKFKYDGLGRRVSGTIEAIERDTLVNNDHPLNDYFYINGGPLRDEEVYGLRTGILANLTYNYFPMDSVVCNVDIHHIDPKYATEDSLDIVYYKIGDATSNHLWNLAKYYSADYIANPQGFGPPNRLRIFNTFNQHGDVTSSQRGRNSRFMAVWDYHYRED